METCCTQSLSFEATAGGFEDVVTVNEGVKKRFQTRDCAVLVVKPRNTQQVGNQVIIIEGIMDP